MSKQHNLRVPDDVNLESLVEQAADILREKGYPVAKYPSRESYSMAAVVVAALQFVIDQRKERIESEGDESIADHD